MRELKWPLKLQKNLLHYIVREAERVVKRPELLGTGGLISQN